MGHLLKITLYECEKLSAFVRNDIKRLGERHFESNMIHKDNLEINLDKGDTDTERLFLNVIEIIQINGGRF